MAHTPQSFGFNTYDLSQGFAATYSAVLPLEHGEVVPAVYHSAVVVFGYEYFFEGGVARRPVGCTRFGPSYVFMRTAAHVTMKTITEFQEWIARKEESGDFGELAYRVIANNCHCFCEAASRFLTDGAVGLVPEIRHNVEKLTAFSLGGVTKDILERLAGGSVLELKKAIDLGVQSIEVARLTMESAASTTAFANAFPPAAIFVPRSPQVWSEAEVQTRIAQLTPFVRGAVQIALERAAAGTGLPQTLPEVEVAVRQVLAAAARALRCPSTAALHPNAAVLLCDAITLALGPRRDATDTPPSSDDEESTAATADVDESEPVVPAPAIGVASREPFNDDVSPAASPRNERLSGPTCVGVKKASRVRLMASTTALATPSVRDVEALLTVLGTWRRLQLNPAFALAIAHHRPLLVTFCDHVLDPVKVPLWPESVLAALLDLASTMTMYPAAGAYIKRYSGGVLALLLSGLFAKDWAIVDKAAALFNNFVLLSRHYSMTSLEAEVTKSGTVGVVRAAAIARFALRVTFPSVSDVIENPHVYADPNPATRAEQLERYTARRKTFKDTDVDGLLDLQQGALTKLLLGLVHLFAESESAPDFVGRWKLPDAARWVLEEQCFTQINHDLRVLLHILTQP